MTRSARYPLRIALAAIAVAFSSAELAQAGASNSAASSPPTATTTTTTVALPTVPSEQAPGAPANGSESTTTQTSTDALAPIGTTGITRTDSPSAAFEKLAHDRAFLTPADVAALPNFADAFAKADRDADGRLDRTEFTDAWSYYIGQRPQPGAVSVTTTTQTQ